MEAKLPAETAIGRPEGGRSFPYSNWGPWPATAGVLMALVGAAIVSIPIFLIDNPADGAHFSSWANVTAQALQELVFLLVSFAIAAVHGASPREAARRLGLRAFRPSALKWMAASVGAFLLFAVLYTAIFGEPQQDDIAEDLGPVVCQVLLIAILAPICEETCFRGMFFGGLRERLPRLGAALISGLVFGGLHATTGLTVVPVLVAFGFILALLYEKTGSIVPGILLHMLNNSVALLGQ
jgi:membrane protease YdiL (CAAX protease family)